MNKAHTDTYKTEMMALINTADFSSRIFLKGTTEEKKQQLITKLGMVNEQFTNNKKIN